jgi:hypothetical protein
LLCPVCTAACSLKLCKKGVSEIRESGIKKEKIKSQATTPLAEKTDIISFSSREL